MRHFSSNSFKFIFSGKKCCLCSSPSAPRTLMCYLCSYTSDLEWLCIWLLCSVLVAWPHAGNEAIVRLLSMHLQKLHTTNSKRLLLNYIKCSSLCLPVFLTHIVATISFYSRGWMDHANQVKVYFLFCIRRQIIFQKSHLLNIIL